MGEAYKRDKVGKKARPYHLFRRKNYVPFEISEQRFAICKQCPELIKPTNQCRQCGCLMHLKTKLVQAECPLGLWR
jgi:hypothetical protein